MTCRCICWAVSYLKHYISQLVCMAKVSWQCWAGGDKAVKCWYWNRLPLSRKMRSCIPSPVVGSGTPASFSQLMAPFSICGKQVLDSTGLAYSHAGTGGWPLAACSIPQVFQGFPSVSMRWLHHMAQGPGPGLVHSLAGLAPRLHHICLPSLLFYHNEQECRRTARPIIPSHQ